MAGPWRRVAARSRLLRGLLRDTEKALHDVADVLSYDSEIAVTVQDIRSQSSRPTALVIFGTTPTAKARLLHCLLGRRLLPEPLPRGCRWLRVQYGSSTQVHLTFGNSEFELVEDLECNRRPWETLPLQDLLHEDQEDQVTMMEVEINNSFLKDGLRIIVPPDIGAQPGDDHHLQLKQIHSELYGKRETILQNYIPIYLYAIDRTGRTIFSDNISANRIVARTEEDFWSTFNLYYMTRGESIDIGESGNGDVEQCSDEVRESAGTGEAAVFTAENCLDLHQIKELDPNSQVFFVLFSDSVDVLAEENRKNQKVEERLHLYVEATESTEDWFTAEELPESDQVLLQDGVLRREQASPERVAGLGALGALGALGRRLQETQIAFMNELMDQWELMFRPPPKHQANSQWAVLDDAELMRTALLGADGGGSNAGEMAPGESMPRRRRGEGDRALRTRPALLNAVLKFTTDCAQTYLLHYCTRLGEVHVKLLQQLILASFDLARELQLVPKKIQYVARQEHQLYQVISAKFSDGDKKQELLQIMQEVLQEMRCEIDSMDWSVDDLPCHQDKRFILSNSVFYSSRSSPTVSLRPTHPDRPAPAPAPSDTTLPFDASESSSPSDVEEAVSYDSYNFDDYEIIHSNDESLSVSECYTRVKSRADDASSLITQIGMIRVENESEAFSMSGSGRGWGSTGTTATSATSTTTTTTCTNNANMSIKQASLDVQQTVLSKLSRMISLKLVKFVDCLKDTYFGTLQRCLQSLEASCKQELGGRPASEAMRRLVCVARRVDLQPCASFSLMRSLLESLRRLFYKLRLTGGEGEDACCVLSPVWRRQVALHTIHSLSPQRLARIISGQILERMSVAHETYQSALSSLESALASRLHHTEDVKLAIRKKYAPTFARLCLESTSMCDLLTYGTPELAREIGRGQYGVVYAARGGWAGHSPIAVKSVLPADERHYHELAMEFFYTRSIPPHPRVVRLLGSLVQRGAAGAAGAPGAPGVLLMSTRYARDLHAAVRAGLTFATRMRIACDIVDGIRYLHSLGLVHRDVKMKNVLLDAHERAALSDLGFCAAEALISGSVVGTPVHMAPELLDGEYDGAVDVYAFGILFWYVCAGNTKLPATFEAFQNKEQLWSKVKRGVRPERLLHFTDECWEVMESCWASEPAHRALLGDVQPKLERILERALRERSDEFGVGRHTVLHASDEDSLHMTGIQEDD